MPQQGRRNEGFFYGAWQDTPSLLRDEMDGIGYGSANTMIPLYELKYLFLMCESLTNDKFILAGFSCTRELIAQESSPGVLINTKCSSS